MALRAHLLPWTGPAGRPAFYRQIAQADLHLVPDAGHLVQLDAPGRVRDLVRAFLQDRGSTRDS